MKVAIIGAGLAGRVLAWRLNELFSPDNESEKGLSRGTAETMLEHSDDSPQGEVFIHEKKPHKSGGVSFSSSKELSITLFDQHDRHHIGTGLVAAAMIAPFTEAVTTEAITQHLGIKSFNLWKQWLPELETKTQKEIYFNQEGTLVVSHAQDDASWQRFNIKAKSVIADEHMQAQDHSSLKNLEPELAKSFNKGLFFKGEGVINNQALYPALNTYIEQSSNIEWIENTKVNIDNKSQNGFLEDFDEPFDYIFDCRGHGARSNGARTDLKELRSVRGEVISVYAPEVNFTRAIRLMHPRYPLYIAPRGDHQYIIGATQLENDDDGPVTVRSGLELLSALYSLHKGFAEAQIIDMLSGLRPTFNNNLPKVSQKGKLVHINGLYRHGYLFAPALINDVINQLFGEMSDVSFPQFLSMDNSPVGESVQLAPTKQVTH